MNTRESITRKKIKGMNTGTQRKNRNVEIETLPAGKPVSTEPSAFRIMIPAGPIRNEEEAMKIGPAIAAAHLGKFTGLWETVVEGTMSVIEVEFQITSGGKRHITLDVLAGPIWDNDDAKVKCPYVCISYGGTWTGHWKSVIDGQMSVCGCKFEID